MGASVASTAADIASLPELSGDSLEVVETCLVFRTRELEIEGVKAHYPTIGLVALPATK
jgi:hypothetical protein